MSRHIFYSNLKTMLHGFERFVDTVLILKNSSEIEVITTVILISLFIC